MLCDVQEVVYAAAEEQQEAFLEHLKEVEADFLRCLLCDVQEVVYAAAEEQQKAFMEHLAQVEAENPAQSAPLEW